MLRAVLKKYEKTRKKAFVRPPTFNLINHLNKTNIFNVWINSIFDFFEQLNVKKLSLV